MYHKIILAFFSYLFLALNLSSNDKTIIDNSFITKYEYGKMLYNNPRGIGCNTCHGDNAKGKNIVEFRHTYDKIDYNCTLSVPSIKEVSQKKFSEKINIKRNKRKKFSKAEVCEKLVYNSNVMPTYFLVEDEINAIYHYVKNLE